MNFVDFIADSSLVSILILVILFLLSIFSWALILVRYFSVRFEIKKAKLWIKKQEKIYSLMQVSTLLSQATFKNKSLVSAFIYKVLGEIVEVRKLFDKDVYAGEQYLRNQLDQEIDMMVSKQEGGLTFLSICSHVSPFLGLFGTVWGIIVAFWNIGLQGSADISVVAPGIAEALVTTIAGLAVAIPASSAYYLLSAKYRQLEDSVCQIENHIIKVFQKEDRS